MNENKKKTDDPDIYSQEISDPKDLRFEKEDLVRGILYSEILGRPLSRRKRESPGGSGVRGHV